MIESHDYRIQIASTGLKTGLLRSSEDGLDSLEVSSPPEFGGPAGIWSPEHLFVASLSSCLMTTFRAMADASNIDVVDYTDDATGHLIRDETGRYRFDEVTLRPRVVVTDPSHVDRTLRLLDKAESVCLIGRSVASSINLESEVTSPVASVT